MRIIENPAVEKHSIGSIPSLRFLASSETAGAGDNRRARLLLTKDRADPGGATIAVRYCLLTSEQIARRISQADQNGDCESGTAQTEAAANLPSGLPCTKAVIALHSPSVRRDSVLWKSQYHHLSPVMRDWNVAPPSVVLPLVKSAPVARAKTPVLAFGSIRAISLNNPVVKSKIPTL